jgi:hypothetical protein
MRNFGILLRKEEAALFSSPVAYAVMTVFLLIMGYSFTLTLFSAISRASCTSSSRCSCCSC